jgi:hypothetical protein
MVKQIDFKSYCYTFIIFLSFRTVTSVNIHKTGQVHLNEHNFIENNIFSFLDGRFLKHFCKMLLIYLYSVSFID